MEAHSLSCLLTGLRLNPEEESTPIELQRVRIYEQYPMELPIVFWLRVCNGTSQRAKVIQIIGHSSLAVLKPISYNENRLPAFYSLNFSK